MLCYVICIDENTQVCAATIVIWSLFLMVSVARFQTWFTMFESYTSANATCDINATCWLSFTYVLLLFLITKQFWFRLRLRP